MSTGKRIATALSATVALALPVGAASAAGAAGGTPDVAPVAAHHPSTLLVGFAETATPAQRALAHAGVGARLANTVAGDVDVVQLPSAVSPLVAARAYAGLPGVAYAHPNWRVSLTSTPNDTLYKDEWGLHNTAQAVTGSLVRGKADVDIDAPEGWAAAFGTGSFPSSGGTRVGILDTGIDRTHLDLLDKTKACATANLVVGIVVNGTCSDDNLHGTHVAGTVGAIANNGIGVAGVAPNAEFAVFKALNAAGDGYYADVIAGIHWLHTTGGAKVISMSIGGPQDSALDKELSEAYAAGVLLVAAAGNDYDATKNWPAYHPDVMSVSSVSQNGAKSDFSTCNADVEIGAPGEDIWSTFPGNTYGVISGTSMATPHVSGVAALVMSEKGLSHTQTRSLLKSSAQGSSGCNGTGIVNLAAALGGSTATTPPPPTTPGAITGTVTDARSKAGISAATVSCGTAGTTTTGSAGTYTLSNVTPGTYTCTATASGYRSKSGSTGVPSGGTATLDFALRK
ncbi:MAG TPA: S8 family serine peptidase [Frankiaceae bacterium]|nr:S8 family serine peptidase [Frankiaceae bacterium]